MKKIEVGMKLYDQDICRDITVLSIDDDTQTARVEWRECEYNEDNEPINEVKDTMLMTYRELYKLETV